MAESKRPSFQFYPGDWLRDTSLRCCSPLARSLWIDMICYMHQGTPYGHLKVNDKVILPVNLAGMVGMQQEVVLDLLAELRDAGVFSETPEGVIYSRRMVKDESLRQIRAAGGIKGGNPALKDNHKVNLAPNHGDKQMVEDEDEKEVLLKKVYGEIISDLNEVCGTEYKSTSEKTRALIRARLNDGFVLDDFKHVHRVKWREWGKDAEMAPYLRPQTLYGTKFEAYRNQKMQEQTATGETPKVSPPSKYHKLT
jgi:uncharacterized phage protein (TIGR02220 family)